ncbi:MAG TPA: fluoride efflux transporter CrcB [Acidimicrobiia bacterium]|nr:fluoride efflux transporter CrcB [Acidimicrobiia bacterium]
MIRRDVGLVALGGALGASARYGITEHFPTDAGRFPVTTLMVNLAGAFALGLVLEVVTMHRVEDRWVRPLVGIGLLGAFTTFSTFAVEVTELFRDDAFAVATSYAAVSLIAGVAAATLGLMAAGWRPRLGAPPDEGES